MVHTHRMVNDERGSKSILFKEQDVRAPRSPWGRERGLPRKPGFFGISHEIPAVLVTFFNKWSKSF